MATVIHINSKNYDKKIDIDNGSKLTYYFKNPIIINEETNLKVNCFINNKKQNSSVIDYPESLNAIETFNNFNTSTNQLGAVSYNQAVIDETTENVVVYLFDSQSQSFYATDARITVRTVKNSNDNNGLIEFLHTDQRGYDFSINQIFYIRKADITSPTTLYNLDNGQTYAIFGVQTLNGATEIKTVSTYSGGNNTILSYATGVPVTPGTFYNIPLYEDDGNGWYNLTDVRCTANVFSTTGTNYGTVVVNSITVGGSGYAINDFLYLDKFSVVDGVYPNTYSASARFATVQVSALVNGIGTAYPSNGISNVILPNPRELPFVDEILYNVPFYEIKNAQYTATNASGTVNIVKNAGNNQGSATLVAITDGGSGFAVPITLYLDKEDLIVNNNVYFSNRYISFDAITLVDDSADRDIVILSGNYGFEYNGFLEVELGFYYYDVPNKDTRIFIEIINPSNATASARIISISGSGEGFVVGNTIEFLRNEVVKQDTGVKGWNKTLSSGNLILQVASVSATNFTTYNVNFYLENILYNNSKYFNSSSFTKCKIFQIDLFRKYLQNDNVILSLTPQIIQSIEIFVDRTLDQLEDFQFCLNLEKNNMYLQ